MRCAVAFVFGAPKWCTVVFFCFYVGRDWHNVRDGSTSLQMVLAAMSSQTSAQVVRDVDKGENDKNIEGCVEQSQAFSSISHGSDSKMHVNSDALVASLCATYFFLYSL